jgi:DNA-binding response OmpR family regulator
MKKKTKILLAEDYKHIVKEGKGFFKRGYMDVFTADTAEEALKTHRTEKVDFILADLDLPEMGGDKLCSTIREDQDLRRVYVTLVCSGRDSEIKRCGECGANNYMKRPAEPKEVIERIVRVFELTERRAKRVLIKVSVNGMFKNESFFCTSRDISVMGILLETEKILAKDDNISCSFFLPDFDRMSAEGRVVRVEKFPEETIKAYGVEFTRITLEARKTIKEFVKKRLEDNEGE